MNYCNLKRLMITDATINITDRNLAACVNYNHLLNQSEPNGFVSCTGENEIAATVADVEADGDSVVLQIDHRTEGTYTCECQFSKMTLLYGLDKYMVRNAYVHVL